MKKLLVVFAMTLMALPQGGFASKTAWENLNANQVWNHDTYRVAELNLPPIVDGPFNLGDNVLVQTTASSCATPACSERDAFILRNGSAIRVPNVPKGVLDLDQFLKNDGRVVWAAKTSEDRYVIVELDLVSGQKINLTKEFFVDGVESIKVMVAGADVYINPTFSFDEPNRRFKEASVFRYSPERDGLELVTKRYTMQHEELLDIDTVNRRLLTKMTFPNGDSELFLTKLDTDHAPYGEFDRIVGSYTPSHESIVGAHFRPDGSVEYFRLFDRHVSTTDKGVNTISTAATGENLNWLRNLESTIFVEGDNMVYVNMDGELAISTGDRGVIRPASVGSNPVAVNTDHVFYISADGMGHVYDLESGIISTVDYRPMDAYQQTIVGTTPAGEIMMTNTAVSATLDLGFGTSPAMSDAYHVYWRGVNGHVFEATVASSPKRLTTSKAEAVKVDGSSVVYLVDGVNRWAFMNEDTYFSWFSTWDDVKVVSPAYLDRFRDRGPATLSPGARVKTSSDARVYVVGRDGKLHWIVNEDVARAVYGPTWNAHIVDLQNEALLNYQLGATIEDTADWQQL